MKTNEIKKEQSVLVELRTIRDKISNGLKGRSEQIVEHLKKKKTLLTRWT